MHTYIVNFYSLRSRPAIEGRKSEVTAATAQEAIEQVLNASHYASKTRRWQRHTDEAVRDNAHYQCDTGGFCGASAIRKEIADRPTASIDAEQQAIVESGAGGPQTALARAGND